MKIARRATADLHHRHPLRPRIDQLGTGCARAHIQLADIHRGRPLRFLHPAPVPIIHERRRHGILDDPRRPIFGIPGERPPRAPTQVAVGIITVGIGADPGHRMRPRARGPTGVVGIPPHLAIVQQIPDLVVAVRNGPIAARGPVRGLGEAIEEVGWLSVASADARESGIQQFCEPECRVTLR